MIAAIIVLFGICVYLFLIRFKLDTRVYILESLVDLLLDDRKEFYKTWERMKEEEEPE